MSFSTFSGKMSPDEIKQLMKVIELFSQGQTLKSKSGKPDTHKAKSLKDQSSGKWKEYLKDVPERQAEKALERKLNKKIFG